MFLHWTNFYLVLIPRTVSLLSLCFNLMDFVICITGGFSFFELLLESLKPSVWSISIKCVHLMACSFGLTRGPFTHLLLFFKFTLIFHLRCGILSTPLSCPLAFLTKTGLKKKSLLSKGANTFNLKQFSQCLANSRYIT